MNPRDVTPEMARAELERRQAAKQELQRRQFDNSLAGSISKIPGYAAGAAISLPGKLIDVAKQVPGAVSDIVQHPINSARDLAGGVARGSQNLASALLEGGEYITRKGAEKMLKQQGYKDAVVPKWNAREFMGLEGDNQVDLGKMIESDKPNPLISAIGQYGMGGAAGGVRMLPMMAANAANAAVQAKPGERMRAGVEGAVSTALPVAAVRGANKLRPSKMLAGNLTPEQLQANLSAAEGTSTGLGDVIGSPGLKRLYENVLPRVPGTGADTAMQGTATQLIKQGEGHLGKLGEGLPQGDMGSLLQDALKKASTEARSEKNANFKRVNDIADEAGVVVPREKFKSKAQSLLDEIAESPELKREMSPEIMSDLEAYAKGEKGNTLRLSNIFKGKLNDKANEAYGAGRNYEYGLFKDLRDSLAGDIDETIKSTKNPELKSAYDTAMTEYGSKFKPFEDRDITKFTRQGGDPDMILQHFLKGGANDRGTLLSKVTSKLPPEARNLPAYMHLSKALEEGQLNPMKLRTLYKNLGTKQKEALIPDAAMRKSLDKYTKSVGMNTEAFQTMLNPKTGQRVSDMIPTVGAMAGYSMMGGGIPGLLGGAAGMVLPGMLGKGAVKLMTSPGVRESLVKAIIKAKSKEKL